MAGAVKFSGMQNPFKSGDIVLTKLKGKEVQAAVSQIWKNEVQVKTADGQLLWRTMYTVWRPGEAPLAREQKTRKATASASNNTAPPPKAATSAQRSKGKKSPAKRSNKRR